MGRTYNKSTRSFDEYDDRVSSGRSGKHAKHTNGKKTGGMKTLNSYVEEDYYFDDIEYIIFQTTQPYRSRFPFTYKNQEYFIYPKPEMAGLQIISKKIFITFFNFIRCPNK